MSIIGFIGLGIMGAPMVGHIIKGGHDLFAYSHGGVPSEISGAGVTECSRDKEVAENANIVITIIMVPDTQHVESVLFDEGGVAEGLSNGKVVIDISSIAPMATKGFAKLINEIGQ